MEYYLLMPSDTEKDALNESNLLGTESFGKFWPGQGLTILMKMVDSAPEALEHLSIKTDKSMASMGVDEFLTKIGELKIIIGTSHS